MTTMTHDTTTTLTTIFLESVPSLSVPSPHPYSVNALVGLSDGSFVSCGSEHAVKRWLIGADPSSLSLVGTYVGHGGSVTCAAEIDDNTFVTGSYDGYLREWDKATCECLRFVFVIGAVHCLIRSRQSRFLCGTFTGGVEMRKVDDLGGPLIHSFKVHSSAVNCICELSDGSFVSGADNNPISRWDETGRVLQTFDGHSMSVIRVMELTRDIIVTSSWDTTVTVWEVSTGKNLHKLALHHGSVYGLVKLSEDKFVTGSTDRTIRVWNGIKGVCIETISRCSEIQAMTRLGDSIFTSGRDRIEVRRLKYDFIIIKRSSLPV